MLQRGSLPGCPAGPQTTQARVTAPGPGWLGPGLCGRGQLGGQSSQSARRQASSLGSKERACSGQELAPGCRGCAAQGLTYQDGYAGWGLAFFPFHSLTW